jgi:hypothetical protein
VLDVLGCLITPISNAAMPEASNSAASKDKNVQSGVHEQQRPTRYLHEIR